MLSLKQQKAIFVFLLLSASQNIRADDSVPAETVQRNLAADIFYTLLDINTSNAFLNLGSRLASTSFAAATFETIGENLYPTTWFWEDGDRFFINQFGHPYQGSTYFASARINGFSFYESIAFAFIGSFQWEIMYERESSINDSISTTFGGVALGEILHRLFLEADAAPSIGGKIGGFLISPLEGFNAVYNRQKRETGGGNLYELTLKTGLEKSFTSFKGHQTESNSWRYPGAHLGVDAVYGNPFTQESWTPYNHFELNAKFTTNIASYHLQILSDGYIFSIPLSKTQRTVTSTGLTLHYDFFNATNDIIDNTGYGNIQFASDAFDWTIKQGLFFSDVNIAIKVHAGLTFWGTSMYNGRFATDSYLENTYATYGIGENIKLFFRVSHKKAGTLALSATGYHIFNLPVTETHSAGNVLFLNTSAGYTFPITKRVGIGGEVRYWNLFGRYDDAETVHRSLLSTSIYAAIFF
ncbi:MAG: DUF3943 domain-containing protein [Spirochaetaceae bacterium]|jgi:hypothetical protein|nr:DUF3943 domain-containing protein [Spirochaetaceae bacterium]